MSEKIHNTLIIGSGPAGYTAAIYTARANLNPVLIQGQLTGGQLSTTTDVENFPGFPEGIMGPDLMIAMEAQAKRFGCEFVNALVTKVDLNSRPFKVFTDSQEYQTQSLIIATGANPRYLGLDKERELLGYGVSTCATCDGAFFREKIISIVGGGDSACEEALFLSKFGSKVYLIHRRNELRASKIMQERVLNHKKIEVIWNSVVTDLTGSKEEGLQSITLENTNTKEKSEHKTDALFIAIGHTPNSELFKGVLEQDKNGYLITAPDSAKTNIKGVFACGDVKDHVYRQAITAAGSGCMAAIEAERFLSES